MLPFDSRAVPAPRRASNIHAGSYAPILTKAWAVHFAFRGLTGIGQLKSRNARAVSRSKPKWHFLKARPDWRCGPDSEWSIARIHTPRGGPLGAYQSPLRER